MLNSPTHGFEKVFIWFDITATKCDNTVGSQTNHPYIVCSF